MLADLGTVLWKEWRELSAWRGTLRGGWLGLLVFAGVFGVYMPLQSGREWVTSPIALVIWAWVPLFLVSSVVADSFAGERERHTLETLLASRLPDRAILFGKIAAAVGYGWLTTLGLLLLGVVTVNVATAGQGLIFYPPLVAIAIVVLSFLAALLVASVGVLVSLRAATVRQAAQTLALGSAAFVFAPVILLQVLPEEVRASAISSLSSGQMPMGIVLGAAAALAAIDALVLVAAMARFRRSLLILA